MERESPAFFDDQGVGDPGRGKFLAKPGESPLGRTMAGQPVNITEATVTKLDQVAGDVAPGGEIVDPDHGRRRDVDHRELDLLRRLGQRVGDDLVLQRPGGDVVADELLCLVLGHDLEQVVLQVDVDPAGRDFCHAADPIRTVVAADDPARAVERQFEQRRSECGVADR